MASNLSLKQSYLKTVMASKGGKSGRGGKPGEIGVRGGIRSVGKRGLEGKEEGVKEIRGTVLDGGKALIGGEKEGWKVLVGLTMVGNFWTNGKVKIRCGKTGLDESDWKEWEDEEVKNTFEGKGKGESEDVEMGEGVEVKVEKEDEWEGEEVDRVIGGMLEGVRGERWAGGREREEKGKKIKEEIEVID